MMPPDRRSTAEVARELGIECSGSDLVRIHEKVLRNLAHHIRQRSDFAEYERSRWDDSRFWNVEDNAERRSQYFTVGNAINFRFWSLVDGRPRPISGWIEGEKFTGSMYLWRSLKRCVDQRRLPVLDAKFLASLSAEDFDVIFSDERDENPLAIAAEDRIANLKDLGARLDRDWHGQFFNLIRGTRGSLVAFTTLSAKFRAYDDPNLKLTMVNAILHSGSGIVRFDADPLPGIDYHLLKQALRHGLLQPNEPLARKIQAGELLTAGEGQELRRVALAAFVRLSEMTGISGEIIDNKWWWNRQKCSENDPVCLSPASAPQCPFYGPCRQFINFRTPREMTRYY